MNTPATSRSPIDRMGWFFGGQLVAGALVSLTAFASSRGVGPPAGPLFLFVLSVPFSQVTLLAAWNALGDSRQAVRPIVSFLFVVAVWLIGVAFPMGFGDAHISPFLPGVAMFAQWVAVQVPLWIVRLTFRWQMGPVADAEQGYPRSVQFGIRHLIIWTTLVAIVLGVSRWMARYLGPDSRDMTAFALYMACNSMFAWPTLLSPLIHRWMPTAIVAALVLTIVVTWSEPIIFGAMIGGGSQGGVFIWLNVIQFVWLLASMLILRAMGYRLIRPRP